MKVSCYQKTADSTLYIPESDELNRAGCFPRMIQIRDTYTISRP